MSSSAGHDHPVDRKLASRWHVVRILVSCLVLNFSATQASELPSITNYDLTLQLGLKEQRADIAATMSVRNQSSQPYQRIPFLLYRLFGVSSVLGHDGSKLRFSQHITSMSDEPSLQVNAIIVNLPMALQPGDSTTLTLRYEGSMFGYPEVMAYVKDRVDEEYSLLRPDAFAFPMLAETTFASVAASYRARFEYTLRTTVPEGYTVACGGELVSKTSGSQGTLFLYKSKLPTWRMDLAVAKFRVLRDSVEQLTTYYLPEDSGGAGNLLKASTRAIHYYMDLFGAPKHYKGYTIVEIPEGWGSQAGDYYFLQTAAAFRDTMRVGEAFHEIGHSWNARASAEVQRCRYFDEAFASFFEALAIRRFRGENAFEEKMEAARRQFIESAERDRQVFEVPIARYGDKEMGRHSYTKGAWSLYTLYELVGEQTFASIIRTMLSDFSGRTIDFAEYQQLCERVSKRDLKTYFDEWVRGSESSTLLSEKVPIADIIRRYEHGKR
ncbi:MAG TPA: M1 family aminopeptidase [Bacteroidota bacterium]|nr:M1 family aminopeptidase [Bacteroidota bacterium]